jgi:hypothetical protein
MRECSDDVRSGMTRSSSARLSGRERSPRESARDECGRDVKLGAILSLSSLELRKTPHVVIVLFHFDFFRFNRRLSVVPISLLRPASRRMRL